MEVLSEYVNIMLIWPNYKWKDNNMQGQYKECRWYYLITMIEIESIENRFD